MKQTKEKDVNALNSKSLAALKRDVNKYKNSFVGACRMLKDIADAGDKVARKVCAYLGITADTLKGKNQKELRESIMAKYPVYYTVDTVNGGIARYPARLKKLPKQSTIDGYIAVKDTYINSLLSLAQLLSEGDTYTQYQVTLTSTPINEDANMYLEEDAVVRIYDKSYVEIADNSKVRAYINYLNIAKNASAAGRLAKANYIEANSAQNVK